MSQEIEQVITRVEKEIDEIQRIKDLCLRRWKKALLDPDYLGSVAFDLHGFYHGVERIFQAFAKALDGDVPSGEAWHKKLLLQMAEEVPGLRPAVISEQTKAALDAYRSFRHVARNVYTFNLDSKKVAWLVGSLAIAVDSFCTDISIFLDFLKEKS